VSSRHSLLGRPSIAFALLSSLLVSACGSDSEPAQQTAKRPPAATVPTTTTDAPTTTTDVAPSAREQRAKRRRAARKRREAKAKAQTTPTTTAKTQPAPSTQPVETTTQPAPQRHPKRTPAAKPKPRDTGPPAHAVTESATLQLVSRNGSRAYVHEGNVVGTLNGTMKLDTRLGGAGVIGIFTVTLSDGTLTGRASASLTLAGSEARFRGTAKITGGTGAYAGASATGLKFSGSVSADASTSKIRMSGDVRW
jgi:hypothetical protein